MQFAGLTVTQIAACRNCSVGFNQNSIGWQDYSFLIFFLEGFLLFKSHFYFFRFTSTCKALLSTSFSLLNSLYWFLFPTNFSVSVINSAWPTNKKFHSQCLRIRSFGEPVLCRLLYHSLSICSLVFSLILPCDLHLSSFHSCSSPFPSTLLAVECTLM